MKNIVEAAYHLMFFQTYTTIPRWMEIGYGIIAWGNVVIIIWVLT
jgi:hypothetical protein